MKNPFDLNLPIQDVAEIMNYLNVSSTELKDPKKFDKFKFVAEFVKDIPNKGRFFSRLSKAGQLNVDKLAFFYEYCNERMNLERTTSSKKFLEEQYLKSGDEELKANIDLLDLEIKDIESVIETYES